MVIRIADYIAKAFADYGIKMAFSVVGGGAMNLNDAFGHSKDIKVVYCQHEQACAIAAEGYARLNNEVAAVVVTTGPGGTNALTGVVGAFVDSVPMVVLSGQVRRDSFSVTTGLPLRAMGDQEFNIVSAVQTMTKYAACILNPEDTRYVVEKALYLSTHGRMGPTWIDVPGDIASMEVDINSQKGYLPEEEPAIKEDQIKFVINKIKEAKRPVIYAGSAIRLSGCFDEFQNLIHKLNVPVVTAWNSTDAIQNDDKLFAGRAGNFGDRFGNFAVQNSDLILSLGCRLSIRQTGFNYKSWARDAYVIMVDIDENEMKKPTIHVEYPIHGNVKDFICRANDIVGNQKLSLFDDWINQCQKWKKEYPVVNKKQYQQKEKANAYAVIDMLSKHCKENTIVVSGNGTACVVGGQAFITKKGTRFIENSGMASMGYDLPAAIGTCFANKKQSVICITGDGSIQMNLQELQTIAFHKLPIKIVLINNGGYHSIRQSQSNFFKGRALCGIGPDSGDLSFPDMKKIAWAYGIEFYRLDTNRKFKNFLDNKFDMVKGPAIIEVMVDAQQYFQPKAGSRRCSDGSMVSAPLEDLAPYLDRDELKRDMIVSLWDQDKK
jgi:acetolactate synthase-1/2/3 large subunit